MEKTWKWAADVLEMDQGGRPWVQGRCWAGRTDPEVVITSSPRFFPDKGL